MQARRERLRNWLRISAFELSHRHLARHQGIIRRFRPEFIYGYSSAIYQLALFYSEHTLPPPPGLEAIFFTAEPPRHGEGSIEWNYGSRSWDRDTATIAGSNRSESLRVDFRKTTRPQWRQHKRSKCRFRSSSG